MPNARGLITRTCPAADVLIAKHCSIVKLKAGIQTPTVMVCLVWSSASRQQQLYDVILAVLCCPVQAGLAKLIDCICLSTGIQQQLHDTSVLVRPLQTGQGSATRRASARSTAALQDSASCQVLARL
jgi:hypothetical protein